MSVRVTTAGGRTRNQNAKVAALGTYGATLRTLMGSLASDPANVLASVVVTCDAGRVSCPASFSLLAAPTCTAQ